MYKQTTILLSLTNIIGLYHYNNECSANKYYKEQLKIQNEIVNELQTHNIILQENLEKIAIKMKNNDNSNIDIDKYIDFKRSKYYNLYKSVYL